MSKHKKEIKTEIIARCKSGETVPAVSQNTGIPKSTIYAWFSVPKVAPELSPKECDTLNVSRGTFYNHILRNKKNNTVYSERREIIKNAIQTVYDESKQIFGARKIAAVLRERGYKTCKDTVRKLMHDMGLSSIRQRAKFLYEKERRIANKNILQRQFNPSAPNQIWVSDVNCFYFNEKNYYICAILDLFSRKVIGYKIGIKNSTQLTKSTFKYAYLNRMPKNELLFHTNNGSNYRSYAFCGYLKALGVQ